MKKAFTLIELLVVIAIIAILAAILFPVFTQAKIQAKKTQCLSQIKQTGTAIIMYADDNDDTFPTGTVPNLTTGGWRPNDFTAQSPAGWFNWPGAQEEYALVWHNTISTYTKSYDVMSTPAARVFNINDPTWNAGLAAKLKQPKPVNFTYNGLLQHLPSSECAVPSQNPMIWLGQGNFARNGAAMANPRLLCTVVGPCRFNSAGMPDGTAGTRGDVFTMSSVAQGGPSYTPYNNTNIYVFSDTSAKAVKYAKGNQAPFPASTNSLVPIQFLEENGQATSNFIRGRYAGSTLYVAAFMPDNQFNN
ncbi:MAG: prepilin-type N-terminal cleavage/methylation domain-containing protein [Chthonomonas sp.]|nr:prepilin-type N-terminal cleavage/methylation domain-containing protein [Chthonomonas sp.]